MLELLADMLKDQGKSSNPVRNMLAHLPGRLFLIQIISALKPKELGGEDPSWEKSRNFYASVSILQPRKPRQRLSKNISLQAVLENTPPRF